MTTSLDPAELAAVTDVQVFAVDDCSGLSGLARIDGAAVAAITTNAKVQAALTASGDSGGEVVGYTLEGHSLTVYVRHSS